MTTDAPAPTKPMPTPEAPGERRDPEGEPTRPQHPLPSTSGHAEPLLDVRQLSELLAILEPHGFCQVNRSQAVNLRRIREIRRTSDDAWELKLDPPVNLVLPISRRRVAGLWECFGE